MDYSAQTAIFQGEAGVIQEQPQIFSTQLDQKHVEISSGEHPGGHDARESDIQRELLIQYLHIAFV